MNKVATIIIAAILVLILYPSNQGFNDAYGDEAVFVNSGSETWIFYEDQTFISFDYWGMTNYQGNELYGTWSVEKSNLYLNLDSELLSSMNYEFTTLQNMGFEVDIEMKFLYYLDTKNDLLVMDLVSVTGTAEGVTETLEMPEYGEYGNVISCGLYLASEGHKVWEYDAHQDSRANILWPEWCFPDADPVANNVVSILSDCTGISEESIELTHSMTDLMENMTSFYSYNLSSEYSRDSYLWSCLADVRTDYYDHTPIGEELHQPVDSYNQTNIFLDENSKISDVVDYYGGGASYYQLYLQGEMAWFGTPPSNGLQSDETGALILFAIFVTLMIGIFKKLPKKSKKKSKPAF